MLGETLLLAAAALIGLMVIARAVLNGWREWLALKRLELETRSPPEPTTGVPAARIELADLRERVRKLEAIAGGIDL